MYCRGRWNSVLYDIEPRNTTCNKPSVFPLSTSQSIKEQYVSDFHLMYGVGMGDRENPAKLLVERVVGEGHEAGA